MEIERIVENVFENARKGRTEPPYLDIRPKDIRVQTIQSVAPVTFHLHDPNSLAEGQSSSERKDLVAGK